MEEVAITVCAKEDLTSTGGSLTNGSVGDRPVILDRRENTETKDRSDRPIIPRRDSLMNERTRLNRPFDSSDEKRLQHRHSSLRKRKSDELGSIDLSELDGFEYNSREKERSVTSPLKISLDSLGDAFFDMNSRWQQVFKREACRKEGESEIETPMHRNTIVSTPRKEVDPQTPKQGEPRTMYDILPTPKAPCNGETPLFRHFRHQSSSSHEGESPCSVAALTRGCGVCFWERSLAWSEDDEDDADDSIVHPSHNHKGTDIREHLSVPEHLGKEFAETQEIRSCRNTMPIRRSSPSRITTLETDSRHKLRGSKMFRQTDLDQVTEIHWEEKVVDTTALELMAKLSL